MFKPILALLAGAVLILGTPSAEAAKAGKPKLTPEQVFAKRDKNGDGKLTLQEFIGRRKGAKAAMAAKVFAIKDKNGDGVLTLDEFKTRIKKRKG